MKIPKSRKISSKKIAIISLVVLAAACLGVYGLYRFRSTDRPSTTVATSTTTRQANTVDYDSPTQSDQQQQESTKTDIIKQNDQQPSSASNSNISVTIARANQDGAGLPLNIRTIITGGTSGTCNVSITRSGQSTVSRTFSVTPEATYYTCGQADIPASSFSADGDWTMDVTVTSNSVTSKPATSTINIKR